MTHNTTTLRFEDQSYKEEIANAITHGIGVGLSLAATSLLVVYSAFDGSAIKIVCFSIFGMSLTLLYLFSTLYHGIQRTKPKRVLHLLDHSAIYVLIAGTYTPVSLIAISGGWGWSLFGVVWGLALLGILSTLVLFERTKHLSLALYIALGWLIVLSMPAVIDRFSTNALLWLLLGGISYTAGTLFYCAHRLPYHHMIWHLFVLGGSTCHFFLMIYL